MRIGVLALQGGFREHIHHLQAIGCETAEVRQSNELADLDGLILPGGESTTMGKLLCSTGIYDALKEKIQGGLPVWGTCAGMILLAKNLENDETRHLGLMDITVRRNAYGRQADSFVTHQKIGEVSAADIPLVFIRAPFITKLEDPARVLCKVADTVVAVRQGHMIATSFHPELTDSTLFHQYFLNICRENKKTTSLEAGTDLKNPVKNRI